LIEGWIEALILSTTTGAQYNGSLNAFTGYV